MRPLREIIPEQEFLRLAQRPARAVLRLGRLLQRRRRALPGSLCGYITVEARLLQDFLDEHGAKYNRTWYRFREWVSVIGTLAYVSYLLDHLRRRHELVEGEGPFARETEQVRALLEQTLRRAFSQALQEAQRLGLGVPQEAVDERALSAPPLGRLLPHDLEETGGKHEVALKLATQIVELARLVREMWAEGEDPLQLMPHRLNEEAFRRLEQGLRTLQTLYDTHLRGTVMEREDPELARLRHAISMVLHLVEALRALCHLYEKYRDAPRYQFVLALLQRQAIWERFLPWSLPYVGRYMRCAEELARGVLERYSLRREVELPVPQGLGFHMRPATLIAKVVNHYGSKVQMVVGGERYDAGSVLNILWAGGKIAREGLKTVTFVGDERVLRDLEILARANYGEDLMGKEVQLPPELDYLR